MSRIEVTAHAFLWSPNTNTGRIGIVLKDGKKLEVPIHSAEEYVALATTLGQSPVFMYPDGAIGSDYQAS